MYNRVRLGIQWAISAYVLHHPIDLVDKKAVKYKIIRATKPTTKRIVVDKAEALNNNGSGIRVA